MGRFTYIFAAAAIAVPALSVAGSPGPGAIEGADWALRPNPELVARYYPDRAASHRVTGWAAVICKVRKDGGLRECRAGAEAPEGYEFGVAGVAVASKLFRMTTITPDGRPTEGAVIIIPLSWGRANGTAPAPNFTPGSPAYIAKVADHPDQQTMRCPTQANPDRQCYVHVLNWTEAPSVHDIASQIRAAGDAPSRLNCLISADGRLSDCRAKTADAGGLLKLTDQFRAASNTEDGLQTAGERVTLSFDWKALRKFLATYDAVYEAN